MRPLPRALCALFVALCLALPAGAGLCAQKNAPKAKKRRAAQIQNVRAAAKPARQAQKPRAETEAQKIPAGDLLHPYADGADGADSGRLRFDPTPAQRPFGKAEAEDDALPFRLRLKQERVIDPLTQKELTPKADPLKAKESLKNLDVKDTMDKIGGKAEVQVDILKF
jgi:hypothetical protein